MATKQQTDYVAELEDMTREMGYDLPIAWMILILIDEVDGDEYDRMMSELKDGLP